MPISLLNLYNKYGLNKLFIVRVISTSILYCMKIIEIEANYEWIKIDCVDSITKPPNSSLSTYTFYKKEVTDTLFCEMSEVSNSEDKQKCNCDFYNVILITGCKCGGI